MGSGREHGKSAPDDHHAWEEDAGFEVVEGEVGRNLADDVAAEIQHEHTKLWELKEYGLPEEIT
jgi:hypothetical protein